MPIRAPRSIARHLLAMLVMISLLLPALARAQDTPGLDAPDVGGYSDQDLKQMGDQERLRSSSLSVDQMRKTLAEVADLLDRTRQEEKDILKLNCINSKLSAIKAFVKLGERANVALQSASNKKDEPAQIHQTKLIFLADARVQSLRDEVETCSAGDLVPYTGPSRTIIEIDDDILKSVPLDEDTEVVPLDPLPEVSPYQ